MALRTLTPIALAAFASLAMPAGAQPQPEPQDTTRLTPEEAKDYALVAVFANCLTGGRLFTGKFTVEDADSFQPAQDTIAACEQEVGASDDAIYEIERHLAEKYGSRLPEVVANTGMVVFPRSAFE